MDSSSDGSFAWTDASNDTVGSENKINGNMSNVQSECESDSGKKYKKILQQELLIQNDGGASGEAHVRRKERKRKLILQAGVGGDLPAPGSDNIKREPESDIDTSLRQREQTNGHSLSECYDSFDESHLRSRVAAERLASRDEPEARGKHRASETDATESLHLVRENEKSQKKNKKSKLRKLSANPEDSEPTESARSPPPPPPPPPRAPRMSERITFEEDDTSPPETHYRSCKPSIESAALRAFQSDSDLTPIAREPAEGSALTAADDVWIVRCPRDVDVDAFHDRVVSLEGKCKLKLNGQTYEGIVDGEGENVSFLSSDRNRFVIKNVVIKGIVNLHKRIPKSHVRDDAIVNNPTSFIALPETKCRHPLFGADYKGRIKVAGSVARRLQPHARAPRRRPRAAAASDPTDPTDPDPADPDLHSLSDLALAKKKKKKRKLSSDEHVAPVQIKRTKRDLESAEAWESEQAIEENLFNF